MKIYVITSEMHSAPLAEIRTDGTRLEFIIDNTNGKLPRMFEGSFARARMITEKSSHLHMDEPTKPTVSILRYVLENGSVVEITNDGKTATLNGKILEEAEKAALFSAIRSGNLKVKTKADTHRPIPILPSIKTAAKPKEPGTIDTQLLKQIRQNQEENKKADEADSVDHDKRIEAMDFSGAHNPDTGKALMYALKYGSFKGGVND